MRVPNLEGEWNFRRQGEWRAAPNLGTKTFRASFQNVNFWPVLTRKTKALWKMLNCFTWEGDYYLETLREAVTAPGPSPIPLSLCEESGVLHQEEGKVSLSPNPTLYIGCVCEFEPKGNSRPGSRFDPYRGRATRTLPSAEPARGPLRASFPASWLGWCAQPDNVSPPVPARGGTSCLPATGAFPLPPKSTGVSALQDTLQPRPCRRPESRKWNWAQETTNSLRNLRPVTELQFPLW